ncbi:MAG: LURP-one-related family protein [Tenericutes bacterium]|nr:LURP-one-related family protein [Mycoplasmatota bacterium]
MKHFYLKQKVFSVRDKYKIFDEQQNIIYHCKSSVFSLRHKLRFFETKNEQLHFIFKRKLLSIMPTYYLYDQDGNHIAKVKRRWTLLRPKVSVESEIANYEIDGDYWSHSFVILSENHEVASVRKKFISWGDSYEISIDDEQNDEFLLALVVSIDSIFHSRKSRRRNRY